MSRVLTAEELERAINLLPDIGTVKKNDDNTILKVGSYRLSEAATMQYIAENTTIPVPKVYGSYKDEKTQKTHLVMEYIEGDCLEDVWEDFGLEKKEDIISQLKRILDELRSLEETPRGPYSSEEEFSQGIIDTLLEKEATAFPRLVCEMVQDILKGHKIVLTHGDFLPRNILVKDGKVVAILDWEMAGWYPEYWEYTKIMYRPPYLKSWFKDGMVNKLIKPYYAELAVLMQARQLIW
ncbi:hypothetical protein TWF970_007118 [Orbilia oligospora]|uniref:Protein kinase domain-containing protein n=1 Tax=Orbilia oligospora TaxID=2813651 RepID=A0A7C8VUV9_ORBOL|nr:hypothetical protein TWF970_007118 [Orbilia oligospora]